MSYGWDESAAAWIADQGDAGDPSRRLLLDPLMVARIAGRGYARALDAGCGEGRFCRVMQAMGIETVGVDFAPSMIDVARQRDARGDYRVGNAEALDFADASFDLVVSYVSLLDIPDVTRAIGEFARVLRPGGRFLFANLTSFASAGHWQLDEQGKSHFSIDGYLEERGEWQTWRGINVFNWHRPLSTYMRLLLENGLILRHFDEPAPAEAEIMKLDDPTIRPEWVQRQIRVPWFVIMEWEKP